MRVRTRRTKLNSMVQFRERTTPTERPPLVGKVIANLLRIEGRTRRTTEINAEEQMRQDKKTL
jgi:hypothetical protein